MLPFRPCSGREKRNISRRETSPVSYSAGTAGLSPGGTGASCYLSDPVVGERREILAEERLLRSLTAQELLVCHQVVQALHVTFQTLKVREEKY